VTRVRARRARPAAIVWAALGGLLTVAAWSPEAPARAAESPEKKEVVVAIAARGSSYLPVFLMLDETARLEGLALKLVIIGGGPQTAAALASGSVDVIMTALNTVVSMIGAGHGVRVFYSAGSHAELEWFARPGLRAWSDLREKTVAVSGPGSLTDLLTRRVLARHGVTPGSGASLVSSGTSAARLTALKAGRVDAAVLLPPQTWAAEGEGFVRLGTQATEVAPTWPRAVFAAKESFIAENAATVRAFLRAYVQALRLARANREIAMRSLGQHVRDEAQYHERAYRDAMAGFDERGRLPAAAMPVFWEASIAAGEVPEAWPESRFLDRRFIDSFDDWAPGRPGSP
jgi:NitT/TauT family transport system substrate-binding protein